MANSVSQQRQIKGYLKPKYYALVNAFTEANEMGKSEALNVIVKDYFDRMPETDKRNLLKQQSKHTY